MVIASYFWYSHCTSIYNKFKWKDTEVSFSQDKNANFTFKYNDIRELLDFDGIWKEVYTYVLMYTYTHVHIHSYIHTQSCAYIHILMHTYAHTYISS